MFCKGLGRRRPTETKDNDTLTPQERNGCRGWQEAHTGRGAEVIRSNRNQRREGEGKNVQTIKVGKSVCFTPHGKRTAEPSVRRETAVDAYGPVP